MEVSEFARANVFMEVCFHPFVRPLFTIEVKQDELNIRNVFALLEVGWVRPL